MESKEFAKRVGQVAAAVTLAAGAITLGAIHEDNSRSSQVEAPTSVTKVLPTATEFPAPRAVISTSCVEQTPNFPAHIRVSIKGEDLRIKGQEPKGLAVFIRDEQTSKEIMISSGGSDTRHVATGIGTFGSVRGEGNIVIKHGHFYSIDIAEVTFKDEKLTFRASILKEAVQPYCPNINTDRLEALNKAAMQPTR